METSTSITNTVEIAGTTRPTTRADLPDYRRGDHPVVTIHDPAHLTQFPGLGHALLAVVEAAQAAGLDWDHATGLVTLPLTDDEVTDRVASAQSSWDRERDDYLKAVADPASFTQDWRRSSVARFAAAENLPTIDWTEVPA